MYNKITTEQILKRYSLGERSFNNLDLDSEVFDFSNQSLPNIDFSGSYICASFKNANLKGANFEAANVKTCDFTNANLSYSYFNNAVIDGALFEDANLIGACFEGASEQGYVYAIDEYPKNSN